MITILSPAKTIDKKADHSFDSLDYPIFLNEANYRAGLLKKSTTTRLKMLMNISEELAELNQQRYMNWNPDHTIWPDLPALFAFKGEVFRGAKVWEWNDKELLYSKTHILMLSGLYGLLRPNDRIQPYRLEMGIALKNRLGSDLYSFWKKRLTKAVNNILAEEGSGILVNLASNEYFKALDRKKLNIRIISPSFKDFHNGDYKFLTVYGKHARGLMARFINTHRLRDAEDLKAFTEGGYAFNSRLSKGDNWVFTRG